MRTRTRNQRKLDKIALEAKKSIDNAQHLLEECPNDRNAVSIELNTAYGLIVTLQDCYQ